MQTFLIKAGGENLKKGYKHPDELGKTSSGKTVHGLMHNMNGPLANGLRSAGKNITPKSAANHVHMFNRTFTHQDHGEAAIHHATQAAVLNYKATRAKGTAQVDHMANAERHASLAMAHYHASKATGRGTGAARKSEVVNMLKDYLSKGESKGETKGEGSRGGKIIGHTKSFKPIYASTHSSYGKVKSLHTTSPNKGIKSVHDAVHSVLRAHGNYSAQDHSDAAEVHAEHGNGHLEEMHNIASGFLSARARQAKKSQAASVLQGYLSKSDCGLIKSNNIIGKTSSGIKVRHPGHSDYAVGGKPTAERFSGFTKKDHQDAAKIHAKSPYNGSHNAMMVHKTYAAGHVGGVKKSQAADVLHDYLSKATSKGEGSQEALQVHFHTMWAPKEAYCPSLIVN